MMRYYLGIDGGQSHTTALIADETGRIIGRGTGGPSNHSRAPGGRERLVSAVLDSVGRGLLSAGFDHSNARGFPFFSAHLALTGDPAEKTGIVRDLLSATHLSVGHDAPAALAGAMAGGDGVIVLAGTGSVAYGACAGTTVQIGGLGYVFGDEGSAFDIARRSVVRAIRARDCRQPEEKLEDALSAHFGRPRPRDIVLDFYAETISREDLASFSSKVAALAETGEAWALELVEEAVQHLALMVQAAAGRLTVPADLQVSFGGGVFRSGLVIERFRARVGAMNPRARIVDPRFGPDVGALILAFQAAGTPVDATILAALSQACSRST